MLWAAWPMWSAWARCYDQPPASPELVRADSAPVEIGLWKRNNTTELPRCRDMKGFDALRVGDLIPDRLSEVITVSVEQAIRYDPANTVDQLKEVYRVR